MRWLTAYKNLGHRFKKRRLFRTLFLAWIFLLMNRLKNQTRTLHPDTLLIVRIDLIGDYVLFRNFLAALRQSEYRHYRITLCGNIVFKNLAENLDKDVVDDFIWIDRLRFLKDKTYFLTILKRIHDAGFQVALQPTYSREIYGDLLINASQALRRIGVDGDLTNQTKEQRRLTDAFYTKLIKTDAAPKFEFYRNKEIVEQVIQEHIDLKRPRIILPTGTPVEIPAGDYAVIVVGASHQRKQWPNFHQVVVHVARRYGLSIVLVGHGKRDQQTIRAVMQKSAIGDAHNFCDKTTLVQLADVINRAGLVVSNDTAAVHLAAAVGTPTVCVTLGAHAYRFNNYPPEMGVAIKFVFPDKIDALIRNGGFSEYQAEYNGEVDIQSIPTDKVLRAIDEVMALEF